MDGSQHRQKICADINEIGLPQIPPIPQIILCLHFPGSQGWNTHWAEFNTKVKKFHQSMVDFNWKILEWHVLKSKQLERFGKHTLYIAGTILTGPRTTLIQTNTISDCDVLSEIRKCLPTAVDEDIKYLERTGYKLFLTGKIFIFNNERIVAIDYDDNECDTDPTYTDNYKNCLKFSLYYKNMKINIAESYKRAYGGLKFSFCVGSLGGLLVGLLSTGYFQRPSIFARIPSSEKNMLWLMLTRLITSGFCYTILERILLLKFPQPPKYIMSASTGTLCGAFFGFCDNCDVNNTLYASVEFGLFSLVCNLFADKHKFKGNRLGSGNKIELSTK